jgi:hypothetical protein
VRIAAKRRIFNLRHPPMFQLLLNQLTAEDQAASESQKPKTKPHKTKRSPRKHKDKKKKQKRSKSRLLSENFDKGAGHLSGDHSRLNYIFTPI